MIPGQETKIPCVSTAKKKLEYLEKSFLLLIKGKLEASSLLRLEEKLILNIVVKEKNQQLT